MSTSTAERESEIACSYATTIEPTTAVESSRVFGLDSVERLQRSFSKIGLRIVDASELKQILEHNNGERIIALRESHFYDDRLITAMVEASRDVVLLADESNDACVSVGMIGPVSKLRAMLPRLRDGNCSTKEAEAMGVESVYPVDVVPAYDPKLRKHAPPFVLPADADSTREVQVRIFDAAYKGTTDFVTKWVWPRPARIVTGWCARLGIAPNTVTAVSYLLTLFSLIAFWHAHFAEGLVSAWLMTFLDTVDGKLARVTLTSSKLGDVLDHSLDIIHPPFWWAAWGAGLAGPGMVFGDFGIWVAIVFIGYIVGRLLEGLFILAFGQEMFTWRPFDIGFRLIIARRNPNLVLLTGSIVLGRPDLGLIGIGIWTVSCIFIQIIRIAQAAAFQLRGHKISPYTG